MVETAAHFWDCRKTIFSGNSLITWPTGLGFDRNNKEILNILTILMNKILAAYVTLLQIFLFLMIDNIINKIVINYTLAIPIILIKIYILSTLQYIIMY